MIVLCKKYSCYLLVLRFIYYFFFLFLFFYFQTLYKRTSFCLHKVSLTWEFNVRELEICKYWNLSINLIQVFKLLFDIFRKRTSSTYIITGRRCPVTHKVVNSDLERILTLSWWKSQSLISQYRNQSIDFLCKSMVWFLYDMDLPHERVKGRDQIIDIDCYVIIEKIPLRSRQSFSKKL